MEECIHGLFTVSCAPCLRGPLPDKVVKEPKKKKPRRKRAIVRDAAEIELIELLSGVRCGVCMGLRTGAAFQCDHERAEIAAGNIAEIEAWHSANPDVKGKLNQTAASAAISRVTLRAGLRNQPSPITGLSMGSLIGLAARVERGRAMEWSPGIKPGDELPV